MTTARLVLAIDAGGSSTRALIAQTDGTVLGRGRGGPGNHILSGWDTARASITAAVGAAAAAAGVDLAALACTVAGSAGVGPNGEGREVIESLLSELAPAARAHAVGDMVTAFWGALTGDWGVVVAAGTGSVCYGRAASGANCQVGGWGQIMGDEGSAYDIAVRALRAGAQATDGRVAPTALTEHIAAALGAGNFLEVAFRIYGEPMTRDAIAQLATAVYDAAAAGDLAAQKILADAGTELGRCALAALRMLHLSDDGVPVAYTGAVFEAGAFITDAFQRAIIAECPRALIARADFPPVVGAFKLGLRELALPFTESTALTLRKTLEPA